MNAKHPRSSQFLRGAALAGLLCGAAVGCDSETAAADCEMADTDERDAHVATVERFVEEFKNSANHDIVDELMSSDFVHHLDPQFPPGRDGMKVLGQAVAGGFPDVHVMVEAVVAEDDIVVERSVVTGTHEGDFNGVPATGNSVTWTEHHSYRFEDGKIVEYWPQADLLAILAQIGAFPG